VDIWQRKDENAQSIIEGIKRGKMTRHHFEKKKRTSFGGREKKQKQKEKRKRNLPLSI